MSKVIEIDGPPMAWIQVGDVVNRYKTIAFKGYQPDSMVEEAYGIIERIKAELHDGVVYWRCRPEFSGPNIDEDDDCFRMYFRVTTSPQLSQDFWESLYYLEEEGDEMKLHKGVCNEATRL